MDTIVITKIDTVYIEAPVVEVKEKRIEEIKQVKPTFKPIDKDILFEFDKSIVKRESFTELESIINILNSRPNMKISLKVIRMPLDRMLTTSNFLKIELLPYVSFYFRMALKMIEL